MNLKRLHEKAILPARATDGSAGFDLHCIDGGALLPGCRVTIPTGWAIEIPEGHVGLIWPRSGIAVRAGIDVLAGVIDSDYRGEIGVVLINHGGTEHVFQPGDRVAQLIIQKVETPVLVEVDELVDSVRGDGGFGSTGK